MTVEALAMQRRALPEGHPGIASSLSNLAVLYLRLGRSAERRLLLVEAHTINLAAFGAEDSRTQMSSMQLMTTQGPFSEMMATFAQAMSNPNATRNESVGDDGKDDNQPPSLDAELTGVELLEEDLLDAALGELSIEEDLPDTALGELSIEENLLLDTAFDELSEEDGAGDEEAGAAGGPS
jgi:hypothetical protein